MQAFPPPARDREYQQRFEPIGLLEPESPFTAPANELVAGLAQVKEELERALTEGPSP